MTKWILEAIAAGSLDERMAKVNHAVREKFRSSLDDYGTWAEAVFDTYVIVRKKDELFWVDYKVNSEGKVEFTSDPVDAQMTYSKITEGAIFGAFTDSADSPIHPRLLEAEKAKMSGKLWGVAIIQEGLSKNRAFYPRKVLAEAAPLYEGSSIFMDHEEVPRRFGRSTRDLAGFLRDVAPAIIQPDGSAELLEGKGGILNLTATACITKQSVRQEMLEAHEMGRASLFGLSHDVHADSVAAIHTDRKPFYQVQRIKKVESVDFVTNASAGGRALRLVAGNVELQTLEGDGRMLLKMIEAIAKKGSKALQEALAALGKTPTEEQVTPLFDKLMEALEPAGSGDGGTGAGAADPAQATPPVTQPASQPAPAGTGDPAPVVVIDDQRMESMERRLLESDRRGLVNFLHSSVMGTSLPKLVQDNLQTRLSEEIKAAKTIEGLPTEQIITAHVKEQVDLFGKLAESNIVQPAPGQLRTEMGDGPREKLTEAWDDFFDPEKPAVSLRHLYVETTGDTHITGEIKEATRLTEALNSGSFDQILGDSITRRMVREYQNQAELNNWRGVVADVVPVSDFRTQRRMRFGGYGNLPTVAEGAAYTALTSPTDEEATYAPSKRGGTEQVTIEMIANDDVGSVRRIPTRLARAAAQTLHEFVWDFLLNNSLIYDSVALAAAGHGNNIVATGLSSANLVLARLRMKQQADMDNSKRIGLSAKTLIVPTDLEELAFHLTMATKAIPDTNVRSTAEPSAGNFVNRLGINYVVVDYWTDVNNWWVTASPGQTPMIEIGFLNGREDPDLFVQDSPTAGSMFSNDLLTYKIKQTYGGAVLDFRGFFAGIVA